MSVFGEPRKFHTKFKFQLEIDLGSFAFKSMSELSAEFQEIAYSEGGMLIPHKEPGRMSFADLTIDRAATSSDAMYQWIVQTANAVTHSGQPSPLFKKTATVVQFDRDNSRLRTWKLFNLWPKKFVAGAWDNESDEFTMEQLIMSYDYFTLGTNTDGAGQNSLAEKIGGAITKALR